MFIIIVCIFIAPDCFAQNNSADINKIVLKFNQKSSEIAIKLIVIAEKLFALFLILDVAYLGIRAALGREEIGNTIKQFVMLLMFACFVLAVIHNYHDWSKAIVIGLYNVGKELAGTVNLNPFEQGIMVVGDIVDAMTMIEPINAIGIILSAIIIIVIFALITARIILIQCEMYISMNAAILLLGFGGSSFTKDYSISAMKYVFSVGFKLFVLQIVLGIGMVVVGDYAKTIQGSIEISKLFILIGMCVILYALVQTIPEIASGMINGAHVGGGPNAFGVAQSGVGMARTSGAMMGAAAGAVAGAAVSAGRGAGTVMNAVRAAEMDGHSGGSQYGQAIKSLYAANKQARSDRNSTGSTGQRMSTIMGDKVAASKLTASENSGNPGSSGSSGSGAGSSSSGLSGSGFSGSAGAASASSASGSGSSSFADSSSSAASTGSSSASSGGSFGASSASEAVSPSSNAGASGLFSSRSAGGQDTASLVGAAVGAAGGEASQAASLGAAMTEAFYTPSQQEQPDASSSSGGSSSSNRSSSPSGVGSAGTTSSSTSTIASNRKRLPLGADGRPVKRSGYRGNF